MASMIETILLGLLSVIFLGVIMQALLPANGDLIAVLAGHPVEILLAGLFPLVLIIAAILNVLNPQPEGGFA